jgi:hypothetical protein
MNSLSSGRVARTLDKLHQDAEASDQEHLKAMMAAIEARGTTAEEAIADMIAGEGADYRATYHRYADNFLAVSPAYGRFLYAMARACKAIRIVEFGTSMGISTIYLAAALRDNGGGHLIGTEIEPAKVERARANLDTAGLVDLVDIREGDALENARGCRRRRRSAADRRRILSLPAGAQTDRAPTEVRSNDPRGKRLRAGLSGLCPQPRKRLSFAAASGRRRSRQRVHCANLMTPATEFDPEVRKPCKPAGRTVYLRHRNFS